jgi:hypothetical protein
MPQMTKVNETLLQHWFCVSYLSYCIAVFIQQWTLWTLMRISSKVMNEGQLFQLKQNRNANSLGLHKHYMIDIHTYKVNRTSCSCGSILALMPLKCGTKSKVYGLMCCWLYILLTLYPRTGSIFVWKATYLKIVYKRKRNAIVKP